MSKGLETPRPMRFRVDRSSFSPVEPSQTRRHLSLSPRETLTGLEKLLLNHSSIVESMDGELTERGV